MGNIVKKYIPNIKLEKYKDLGYVLGTFVFLLIVVCVLSSHSKTIETKYSSMEKEIGYLNNLKYKPDRLEFMKNHRFKDSGNAPAEFDEFVRSFALKNKMKIVGLEESTETSQAGPCKNLYNIVLLAWHDLCIFDLIGEMHKFAHGFVTIRKLNISRTSNINTKKQAIKVDMQCALYYCQ